MRIRPLSGLLRALAAGTISVHGNQPAAQVLKLRTWLKGRQDTRECQSEAHAKGPQVSFAKCDAPSLALQAFIHAASFEKMTERANSKLALRAGFRGRLSPFQTTDVLPKIR